MGSSSVPPRCRWGRRVYNVSRGSSLLDSARRAVRPFTSLRAAATAVLGVSGALAAAAVPAAPPATRTRGAGNADPGRLVLADGFDHGNFGGWTRVVRSGDARVRIRASAVAARGCVAAIHVTARAGSRGSVVKALPAGTRQIWATGWFDITRRGAKRTSNVPTFRFFSGATRVLDVSRQNGTGALFVRWRSGRGFSVHGTGRTITLRRWFQIKVHAVANGARSQVTVWLNGVPVLTRTGGATGFASFGRATTLSALRLGPSTSADGDFAADDIVAKIAEPRSRTAIGSIRIPRWRARPRAARMAPCWSSTTTRRRRTRSRCASCSASSGWRLSASRCRSTPSGRSGTASSPVRDRPVPRRRRPRPDGVEHDPALPRGARGSRRPLPQRAPGARAGDELLDALSLQVRPALWMPSSR